MVIAPLHDHGGVRHQLVAAGMVEVQVGIDDPVDPAGIAVERLEPRLHVVTLAEAQTRREPLRVIVQKRSYFDAGKVVPVGSMNQYASQHFASLPTYHNTGELYGEELEITFVEKIRDELRFPNLDALKSQIARDIERAKAIGS